MTETTDSRVRPRRGVWRGVRILFLALILIGLLVRAGVDLWASHRLEVVTAEVKQRHGNFLAAPAPVPESENRARPMRAAATLLSGGQAVAQKLSPFLARREPAAVPQDLRAFVDTNRPALQVAHDGRGRPLSNWEADYVTGSNVPRFLDLRTLSNAIYLAAMMELDAGDVDAAAAHVATGLALSSSLRQEPSLLAQLIRCALGLQQFKGVQRLLTEAEPSGASLAELARWLAEERAPEPMHVGLLGELKFVSQTPLWPERAGWFGRPLMRLASAGTMERIGHLLDAQTGPRPRPASTEAPRSWSPLVRLETLAISGLERAMDSGDMFSSARGVTELAVALRRYRLHRGQYPDALSALVPEYMASLPIDPLTGATPVYVREGGGFRLRAEKNAGLSAATSAPLEWVVPK